MTGLFIDRQPVVLPKDFLLRLSPKIRFLPKTEHTLLNLRCPCQIWRTPKYTGIRDSVFEAGFLQYIRILNGRKTVKYSEMLPDRTVTEFFTELENLFNIAFLVDEYGKTVSVRFKNVFYKNTSKIFVDEVMDEFAETVDKKK
jgi:hypothetical protein